jgi:hypothetical protein
MELFISSELWTICEGHHANLEKKICIYNIEWIHLKYIFYGESTDIDSVS